MGRLVAFILIFLAFDLRAFAGDAYLPLNGLPYGNTSDLVVSPFVHYYFLKDALLPKQALSWARQRTFFGITGAYLDENVITAQDKAIMMRPTSVCSAYNATSCYDETAFYKTRYPSFVISGALGLDGNDIIPFGFSSGYSSEKLNIKPAVMLGWAKRIYLNSQMTSQLVFEGSYWIGGQLDHRPCIDSFDREYYCGNLTAWHDFTYDHNPQSVHLAVEYDLLF